MREKSSRIAQILNETSVCVCQCDVLVEQYEEVIEDWYKGSQDEDLTTYLCEKHVLKGQDTGNAQTTSSKGFILY